VSESTVIAAALAPPKLTPLAPVKPLPVMITVMPPAVLPVAGLTVFTTGIVVSLELAVIVNSKLELCG
jgi:hypothetical protein